MKTCIKCGRSLKEKHFSKYRNERSNICRDCVSAFVDDCEIDVSVKVCVKCEQVKPISEFSTLNDAYDGLNYSCKECESARAHMRRGFGYKPLNLRGAGQDFHHLHLENNNDFGVHLPQFLHQSVYHTSNKWVNMDEINAIALQYWINPEIYED